MRTLEVSAIITTTTFVVIVFITNICNALLLCLVFTNFKFEKTQVGLCLRKSISGN